MESLSPPPASYKRPPITEAAVELRFAQEYDQGVIQKAALRLKKEYTYSDNDEAVDISFDVTSRKTEYVPLFYGIKLSSTDRADVTIFRTNAFLCARLAPYCGWELFVERLRRDWKVWRKTAGVVKLARVGVRYINRIDIPRPAEGELADVKDYLHVWPHTPQFEWGPLVSYSFQAVRPLMADECKVRIYSSTVESPLVKHLGLALDLDIFRESALPTRDEELWNLLSRIRDHKNRLFERCITDRSRDLFNR